MMVLSLSNTVKIDFVEYQEFILVSKVELSYVKTTCCGFQKQKNLRKKENVVMFHAVTMMEFSLDLSQAKIFSHTWK